MWLTEGEMIAYNDNVSLLLFLQGVSWRHWSARAQRSTWTKGTTAPLSFFLSPSMHPLNSTNWIHALGCVSGFAGGQRAPRPAGAQSLHWAYSSIFHLCIQKQKKHKHCKNKNKNLLHGRQLKRLTENSGVGPLRIREANQHSINTALFTQ